MTDPVFDPNLVKKIEFTEGSVNTTDEVLLAQVAKNIRRGLPQAMPYQPNGNTAIIVGGGPSLAFTERDLVNAVWRGGKVVAVNGAYQWCIDRNIRPSAMVLMDAREFNSRFVQTSVLECNYLLASQCHPSAFELCRDRKVTIWHAISAGDREVEILDNYYFKKHFPVTLGTTVSIRAISLMRMLGFQDFEIFGLDSCLISDRHHAYKQPENDGGEVVSVWIRPHGRDDLVQRFLCYPWMIKQCEDFQNLTKERGEMFRINVHGPGLIATMIRTGAQLEPEG